MPFTERPRLTACLIVKDESRHLTGCLESIRDWADEIIVVDTGSSDDSAEIARRVGAKVHEATWEGDFSRARNTALEHATGDWVLSIDADERLDYINGGRLLRLIAEAPPEIDAYQLRIVSAADAMNSGVELVHFYPRLFRRRGDIRFRGRLHEQIHRGNVPLGPGAPKTPLSIYHLGYADPEKNRIRLSRNHDIALSEASGLPDNPSARLKLADTYVMVGRLDEAEKIYDGLLATEQLGELKANIRWNLAVCRFKAGSLDRALEQLDLAVEEFPGLMGTRFMRAELLMEAGRHAEALVLLEDLLKPGQRIDPRLTDIRPQPAFLWTLKGVCLATLGRPAEAEGAFDEALVLDPQLFAAHAHRADLLMALGRAAEALPAYLRACALRPDLGSVRIKAGLILLDQGRGEDGVALVQEAARLDPSLADQAGNILTYAADHGDFDRAELDAFLETMRERPAADAAAPVVPPSPEVPAEESAAAAEPDAADATAIIDLDESRAVRDPAAGTAPAATAPAAAAANGALISVCLIVRNEEKHLPACLDSVREIADEIVVCDTGSTDDTVRIAEAAGARVVRFPWCDDFSAARNRALEAASGSWILVLDADERLRRDSAAAIRELVATGRADGYNVAIESITRGDMTHRFVGNYCRLFRNDPRVRFEGRVHEQVYPALRRAGFRVIPSELVIDHEGYAFDADTMERKKRRNLELLEREAAEKPGDHFVQFNLGVACFSLQDMERAERCFREAVQSTREPLSPEVLAIAHARLSQCTLARGDRAQSARDARNALAIDPDAPIPRFVLATIACHDQKFADAAESFRRILKTGDPATGDGLDRAEVSRELGICLYRMKEYAEAAEAFSAAAAGLDDDAMVRLFLGNALAHAGRFDEAYAAYGAALERDPGLEDARGNLEIMAVELGYRYFDAGNPEEALAVVPADTRNTELLFLKAVSEYGLERLEESRRTLETLNAIDGTFAEAWWNMALVCRSLGDIDAARTALDKFRTLAPGDSRAEALEEALSETPF